MTLNLKERQVYKIICNSTDPISITDIINNSRWEYNQFELNSVGNACVKLCKIGALDRKKVPNNNKGPHECWGYYITDKKLTETEVTVTQHNAVFT